MQTLNPAPAELPGLFVKGPAPVPPKGFDLAQSDRLGHSSFVDRKNILKYQFGRQQNLRHPKCFRQGKGQDQ